MSDTTTSDPGAAASVPGTDPSAAEPDGGGRDSRVSTITRPTFAVGDPLSLNEMSWPLLCFAVVALLAWVFGSAFSYVFPLKQGVFQFDTVVQLLGPAFVASLVIERAVEVVITTWRKFGRQEIESNITTLKTVGGAALLPDLSLASEQARLSRYRQRTMKMAVIFSLACAFIVAVVGVRVLSLFFDIPHLACLQGLPVADGSCPKDLSDFKHSYYWLTRVDIALTTFVVAGGSAGIHSIVNAVTTFADKTSDKAKDDKPSG